MLPGEVILHGCISLLLCVITAGSTEGRATDLAAVRAADAEGGEAAACVCVYVCVYVYVCVD